MTMLNTIRLEDDVINTSIPIQMAPTQFLLPVRKLDTKQIISSLRTLRLIYFPPPSLVIEAAWNHKTYNQEGKREAYIPTQHFPNFETKSKKHRRKQDLIDSGSVPDSGYASAEEDEGEEDKKSGSWLPSLDSSEADVDGMDHIHADPYEREFAVKWITGLIARSDNWMTEEGWEVESRLLDEAVELLDAFHRVCVEGGDIREEEEEGKDGEDGALVRVFIFPLSSTSASGKRIERENGEGVEMQVRLNDLPPSQDDHTSVGLQSWGSSIVFSERICMDPERFVFSPPPSSPGSPSRIFPPIRILELGAGTGMLSIVCAKLLREWNREGEVVATDYHADVLKNLEGNVRMNLSTDEDGQGKENVAISTSHLDWEHPSTYEAKFKRGSFDIILAADVVYQPQHARWIKDVVQRLLAKPLTYDRDRESTLVSASAFASGTFWMILPVRTTGRHEGMVDTVEELFPSVTGGFCGGGFTRLELAIMDSEEVSRRDGIGRVDEDGYRLFRIGWCG